MQLLMCAGLQPESLRSCKKMPSILVTLQSAMRNTENRGGLET